MLSLRNVWSYALLLAAACAPASPSETAGFVYRLGVDTVAVASVTWSKNKVAGVYVNRVPTTSVVRWNAEVDGSGNVSRLERVHSSGDNITERVLITLAN